jgi:hypothetical protein
MIDTYHGTSDHACRQSSGGNTTSATKRHNDKQCYDFLGRFAFMRRTHFLAPSQECRIVSDEIDRIEKRCRNRSGEVRPALPIIERPRRRKYEGEEYECAKHTVANRFLVHSAKHSPSGRPALRIISVDPLRTGIAITRAQLWWEQWCRARVRTILWFLTE